jgi:hypothetical protein
MKNPWWHAKFECWRRRFRDYGVMRWDVNDRIRFLVDGRARATNHKNQFENDDRLSGEWN